MTTIKVTDPKGKEHEIDVMTPEDVKTFVHDRSGPGKKASMKYLQQLGRTLNEIVNMEPEERAAYILSRYEELGVGAGAVPAGGKAKAKGTAKVTQLKAVKAPEPEPEADEDELEDAEPEPPAKAPPKAVGTRTAPPAVQSLDTDRIVNVLSELVGEMRESFASLHAKVSDLEDKNEALTAQLTQQEKTILDTHFITRVIAHVGHELKPDDIAEFSEELYDTLVVEPSEEEEEEAEDEAGNG